MGTRGVCPRVLETERTEVVVVKFPKPLRTRCEEAWARFAGVASTAADIILPRCRTFCLLVAIAVLCLTMLAFITMAYMWIPIITDHCHEGPGMNLQGFNIRAMAAFQNVTSPPRSPWQVTSAYNATFLTWSRNTVTKCFTTYRRMDVRVEYRGQVILEQQIPLEFSLSPQDSRPFSVEMQGAQGQVKADLGPILQAEMRSSSITLNFFYRTRYLIADRRSRWTSNGCVVVAEPSLGPSGLGAMFKQDCFNFD